MIDSCCRQLWTAWVVCFPYILNKLRMYIRTTTDKRSNVSEEVKELVARSVEMLFNFKHVAFQLLRLDKWINDRKNTFLHCFANLKKHLILHWVHGIVPAHASSFLPSSQMWCTVLVVPVVWPSFGISPALQRCALCAALPSVSPAGRPTTEQTTVGQRRMQATK